MTKNQENGGKGMTRVEIATRAWERAQDHADACKIRMEQAIEVEANGGTKKAAAATAKIERAKAILLKAGIKVEG